MKIPGPNDIFEISRSGLFLEKIITATIRPSVAPDPPAYVNASNVALTKMLSAPLTLFWYRTKKIGSKIPARMFAPCSPKNHRTVIPVVNSNAIPSPPSFVEAKAINGDWIPA